MKLLHFSIAIILVAFNCSDVSAQLKPKRFVGIKKLAGLITLDGNIDEAVWKDAPKADNFIEYEPTPFKPENNNNRSEVFLLYSDEGIYVGGYMHELTKDSISSELVGRDGFGNNDWLGVVFDTYQDKLNGFEYFVTPLNEQFDSKVSAGNEDFSWNAVWQSAAKIHYDGWSFEMFIPYSAIRFGKKNIQDWGFNVVRLHKKSSSKTFWQELDPNANGFLTQEGTLTGLENIKPPMRLQFSPYFSTYYNYDGTAEAGIKKGGVSVNGGMDVKYGLNQAFTLDMTLIPDFGQVQTDNLSLNLTPFEQKFSENRAFFTEGTELFNKGDLFYSRRIGGRPIRYNNAYDATGSNESVVENPGQSKLINATKISGRTQKGLGIGILNAVASPQYATIEDDAGDKRKFRTSTLTNYNVFVLDQTLKHNSSISFVNTSVLRSGADYDANVSAALFDFNDKKNKWNLGGQVNVSSLIEKGKSITGYSHSLVLAKTSGRLNFNVYQNLTDAKFDKSDMGYFTNNNFLEHGTWASYNWNKPKGWYNRMRLNFDVNYVTLLTPLDLLKRKSNMFQNANFSLSGNAQTKKLLDFGFNVNTHTANNDFYEPRVAGRFFHDKGRTGASVWAESNTAKKFSWTGSIYYGEGNIFKRSEFEYAASAMYRFNSKFSIQESVDIIHVKNQAGWAAIEPFYLGSDPLLDTVYFSRRNVNTVENILNIKYSFTNRMGLTFRARHSYTKVAPQQFYELDLNGNMNTPTVPFTKNVNQNYNFISVDMIYNWQFAQGSFITIAWKDIGNDFDNSFQRNYSKNLQRIISGKQFTSFSVKVIYFLDYVTMRSKMKKKNG